MFHVLCMSFMKEEVLSDRLKFQILVSMKAARNEVLQLGLRLAANFRKKVQVE